MFSHKHGQAGAQGAQLPRVVCAAAARARQLAVRMLLLCLVSTPTVACSGPQRSAQSAHAPRHRVAGGRGRAALSPAAVDDSAVVSLGHAPTTGRGKPMQLHMARPAVCRAWAPHAQKAARAEGLSANLLLAIAWVESGFRTDARSSAGARGPMQLMPRTSRAFGCSSPERPSCAFPAAAALMRRLLKRFDGRIVYALCAYNAGAGRIQSAWRSAQLPFNVWYAERVLAARSRLERHGCRGQR